MTILIDGKPHRTLVSCHKDGSFTFYDGKKWIERAAKVPWWIIATLPDDEQQRVKAHQ